MGAFNYIQIRGICPECKQETDISCQTHIASDYDGNDEVGRFHDHTYELGQRMHWFESTDKRYFLWHEYYVVKENVAREACYSECKSCNADIYVLIQFEDITPVKVIEIGKCENMSRNKTIEEEFVRAFVKKERRVRTNHELESKEDRQEFFSRLCHTFDKILDERFMEAVQVPIFDEAFKLLKSHGAPDHCYVISFGELDGQKLSLFDALREVVGMGMPSIVVCNPRKLAYFEAEQEYGPPPRFLLKRN